MFETATGVTFPALINSRRSLSRRGSPRIAVPGPSYCVTIGSLETNALNAAAVICSGGLPSHNKASGGVDFSVSTARTKNFRSRPAELTPMVAVPSVDVPGKELRITSAQSPLRVA